MRLIDADALKIRIEAWEYYGIFGKSYLIDIIDTSPTIEPRLSLDNISDEDIEKFKLIWQRARSKGLSLRNERPKGEWNEIQAGMLVCPFCGARPHKDFKNFCAKCGAEMLTSKEDSQR